LRDSLELGGIRFAGALLRALPETAARHLGRSLGHAAHALGVRRAVARANVDRALGASLSEPERRAIVRDAYAHLGESMVEFLALPRLDRAELVAAVDVVGEEYLQTSLAAGRGAICASGHFGNWEVMGASVAARGYPVTFVVQPLRNARADELLNDIRRHAGIDVVPRGMALRRVDAALAANRLVFFMCDQDARRRGVFVPFFGIPASTPKGAAQLAIRRQAPFLPVLGRRLRDGRHHLVFGPPIAIPSQMAEENAVREVLQAFNARLESAVRTAPGQYWWAHRRWKTAPPA
jgi:KDO2-lipid IV(A) lauroyltransferase